MRKLYAAIAIAATSLPVPAFAQSVADDIRDVRAPIFNPTPWWEQVMPYVIASLVTLAFAWLVRLAWRRWHRPRNPMQRAVARIEAARRLAIAGSVEAFADELSEAVRAFVEERFGIHAPQQTTEELLLSLVENEASALRAHREELGVFLRICDEAKFGGYAIEAEAMDSMVEAAKELVTQTSRAIEEDLPIAASEADGGTSGPSRLATGTNAVASGVRSEEAA